VKELVKNLIPRSELLETGISRINKLAQLVGENNEGLTALKNMIMKQNEDRAAHCYSEDEYCDQNERKRMTSVCNTKSFLSILEDLDYLGRQELEFKLPNSDSPLFNTFFEALEAQKGALGIDKYKLKLYSVDAAFHE